MQPEELKIEYSILDLLNIRNQLVDQRTLWINELNLYITEISGGRLITIDKDGEKNARNKITDLSKQIEHLDKIIFKQVMAI